MSNIDKLNAIQHVFEKLAYWSGHDMDDLDKEYETSFCADFSKIEKALKALEIIKDKKVDTFWLVESTDKSLDDYNEMMLDSMGARQYQELTQEEYDLLIEVLR